MEQKKLSLGRMIDLFGKRMVANEKGLLGEESLLSLLSDADSAHRSLGFCCLSSTEDLALKYSVILAEFRLKPENQELLLDIDEALK